MTAREKALLQLVGAFFLSAFLSGLLIAVQRHWPAYPFGTGPAWLVFGYAAYRYGLVRGGSR